MILGRYKHGNSNQCFTCSSGRSFLMGTIQTWDSNPHKLRYMPYINSCISTYEWNWTQATTKPGLYLGLLNMGVSVFSHVFCQFAKKMMIHRWNLGDPAPSLGWENGEGGSTDQHPTIRPTNEAWDHLGWGNSGANRIPTHPKDCLENPLNMPGNAMEHMF